MGEDNYFKKLVSKWLGLQVFKALMDVFFSIYRWKLTEVEAVN